MIVTVCLNPSVDKTCEVESFQFGGTNRVISAMLDAGGKGINVALALKRLGQEAAATGFLYNKNADIFYDRLEKGNVICDFIVSDGSARTNIKLRDKKTGTITEINEKGAAVDQSLINAVRDKCIELSKKCEYMVFTGSMPPGCPPDLYKTLINEIHCPAILDADSTALKSGAEAAPFMIKPNIHEFEALLGQKLASPDEIVTCARTLIAKGVKYVLISMGSDGAMLVTKNDALFAPRIDVDVQSTVGAGDCMVAGFIHGISMYSDIEAVFASAVAAGTAGVMTSGTGLLEKETYEDLMNKVRIRKI